MTSFAFYMPHLRTGGAERVTVNLANHFAARGENALMVLDRRDGALIEALDPRVELVSLDAPRTLAAIPRLRALLNARRPDVLLSGITHNSAAAILAALTSGGPTKVAVAEHTVLSQEFRERGWRYAASTGLLVNLTYWRAAAIIAPTAAIADDLAGLLRLTVGRARIDVLANPVVGADVAQRAARTVDDPWLADKTPVFVAAGRLAPVKDFPALIGAFARMRSQRDARLIILGDGPLREALIAEANAKGVAGSVKLPGAVADPLPYFARATAVVSSSRYEGFGNVLVEALACGTPVISTDCPGGPRGILDGGRYGKLVAVGDADALAAAMSESLDARVDPALLREGAARYAVDRAGDAYLEKLKRLL